jgi:hypothetical protein
MVCVQRLSARAVLDDSPAALAHARELITASTHGFFVENHVHTPKVEHQIAELASGDLTALAAELVRRGHDLNLQELGAMYVHVELDPDVSRRVHDLAAAA